MADDDEQGGIGAGTVATGVVLGAGAGAGTAYLVNREKTGEKLAEAQAALAEVHAKHGPAIDVARTKVMLTPAGRKLASDAEQARQKLTALTQAQKRVEQDALIGWERNGSPEAIRSGNPDLINASKAEAVKYKDAVRGVDTERKALRDTTSELTRHYKTEYTRNAETEFAAAREKLKTDFIKDRTGLPRGFNKTHMDEFMAWRDKEATLRGADILTHEAKLPDIVKNLPADQKQALLEKLNGLHENYKGMKPDLTPIEQQVQEIVGEKTKYIKAALAEHEKAIEELTPLKTAIIDKKPIVMEMKAGAEAAEKNYAKLKTDWESALGKHAGTEMRAVNAAESKVNALSKRAGILAAEEGNFLTKAFKARPGLVIAVPVVVLGAVIALKKFMSGGHKSEESAWQSRINQERAMAAARGGQAQGA